MKLGTISRAATALAAASALSAIAAAQNQPQAGGLNIPDSIRFVGNQEPGVRKATAIVNGEVITGSDIDHRIALLLASNEVELSPEDMQRARAQVLRNLIDEALQIQAAAQQEVTVEQREIDAYYARMAQAFQQTPATMANFLRSIGSSERSLKRQIRGELSWQRLQRRMIEPFVTVGDEEVQAVIDRLQAARGTPEYRVAEIFISATPETMNEARTNATRIVQQIRAGGPFPAYARQFSEASTAAVGGDLGWVRAEQLPDELAAMVRQMPVGAISDPIPLQGGFSIVALADSRRILVPDSRDSVLSLMQMSIAFPPGISEQQALATAARMERATQTMGGCGGAEAAATSLGAELISNDQVLVRGLPPQLQQTLLALNVGQATPPFGTAERVSVLIVCGRDDPQEVTAPSFDEVYTRITDERVARRAQRYLRDLRRDAVIDYR